jgi:sugar/nucleoside kinase (ribokinase family)
MTHVVCLGDVMSDVVALLPGPLGRGTDTPAPIRIFGGGAAANVAAWCAASGGQATFLGRVGDDALGRRAVEELEAGGVTVRVTIDATRPTGTCIVLVDPNGERSMVPSSGANDAPADLDLLPVQADWLYVSGYALLNAGSRATALAALSLARQRGWSLAVDAASAAPLRTAGGETFLAWLGADVLLLANADEAEVLAGTADATVAAKLLGERLHAAVVKCGAEGAVWSDGADHVSVPATPAAAIVDTTGAGDAFAAGFLSCTGDVVERLVTGTKLAARAITQLGGRPSSRHDAQ